MLLDFSISITLKSNKPSFIGLSIAEMATSELKNSEILSNINNLNFMELFLQKPKSRKTNPVLAQGKCLQITVRF